LKFFPISIKSFQFAFFLSFHHSHSNCCHILKIF
jgi:hypothetical protein